MLNTFSGTCMSSPHCSTLWTLENGFDQHHQYHQYHQYHQHHQKKLRSSHSFTQIRSPWWQTIYQKFILNIDGGCQFKRLLKTCFIFDGGFIVDGDFIFDGGFIFDVDVGAKARFRHLIRHLSWSWNRQLSYFLKGK